GTDRDRLRVHRRVTRLEQERAFLHHVAGIGDVAFAEQDVAVMDVAALGADGHDAQGVVAEQRERTDALEKVDIVFDAHAARVCPAFRPESGRHANARWCRCRSRSTWRTSLLAENARWRGVN